MSKIKQEEKLTIIIPAYGTDKYIKKCLDSVVAQTWKNLEVIVVDDATKDDAAEIAEQYAEEYPYIKVLHHKENLGLFRARVTGLKAMTGDYFAFLDSDDAVTIDYYRLMMRKAEQTGADIVAGDFLEVYDTGEMNYPCRVLQQSDFDVSGKEAFADLLAQEGQDFGWHVVWNKIYARHIRDELIDYLQKVDRHLVMCEDVAYSVLIFSKANHFANVHGEYYLYSKKHNAAEESASLDFERCKEVIAGILYAFEYIETYLTSSGYENYLKHIEAWKENASKKWFELIKNIRCSYAKRKQLEKMLLNLGERDDIKTQNFFDLHNAPVNMLELQQIKEAIASKKCEIVSFDIFDTLILRPFWQPTDLFMFMEPYVTQKVGTVDTVEFHLLRAEAERDARNRVIGNKSNVFGEVKLDDIYVELGNLCPLLKPHLDEIKQYELECELRFCSAREKGKELIYFALEAGKNVIYTSDMYLPSEFILRLLKKNGFPTDGNCYISCEVGLSKAHGALYDYIVDKLGNKPSSFVHVGDNYHSDVESANQHGWRAFHLPKTIDCMMNIVNGHFHGSGYYKWYCDDYGYTQRSAGLRLFWGIRCLTAVAANHVFDDPFVPMVNFSDYSANPNLIGYMAFGPYLYALSYWLVECQEKNNFDQINFVARDGYLPLKAFEELIKTFSIDVKCNYIYASRKTITPLIMKNPSGIYSMPENYNLNVLAPEKLVKLFKPLMQSDTFEQAKTIVEEGGMEYKLPFYNTARFEKFASLFIDKMYDEGAANDYFEKVGRYYTPYFEGHCATFDVGYSGRLENALSRLYGYDITACYMHINRDNALIRKKDSGFKLETFYDFTPIVSGTIREQIISYCGPSCVGFNCSGNKAEPIFEQYNPIYSAEYVTKQLQKGALQFVQDLCETFGKDLQWLPLRKSDACVPMEHYFHYAMPNDTDVFMAIPFEDDLGAGKYTIRDQWKECMDLAQRHEKGVAGDDPRLDYYSMSKPKKWLVWCLVDRKILKDTAKRKLQNHPVALSFFGGIYRGLRKVAHALHIVR